MPRIAPLKAVAPNSHLIMAGALDRDEAYVNLIDLRYPNCRQDFPQDISRTWHTKRTPESFVATMAARELLCVVLPYTRSKCSRFMRR